MKTTKFFVPALLTALLIASCKKDSGDSGGGNNNGGGNGGGSGGGTTPGALFTAVRSVLQSNCALSGCHAGASPQNGINFSDNNTIVAQGARIKVRAVDQSGTPQQMPPPPNAALSTADQKRITDWIAAGGRLTD